MNVDSAPREWTRALLGDVCEVIGGSTPKTTTAENWNGDIPWLTPNDLSGFTGKYITHGARFISQAGYDSTSTKLMPEGTVLFTSRAPIGYVAIAAQPMCTNQGFKSFVPSEVLTSEFLYWYLRFATPTVRQMGSGTTFPEISGKVARAISIAYPHIDEQRRIVEAIETHLSHLDAGVESLKRGRRNVKRMRDAVLQNAVTGQLVRASEAEPSSAMLERITSARRSRWETEEGSKRYKEPAAVSDASWVTVPGHWSITSLESVTDPLRVICYGILKPRTEGELEVPYVEVRDIRRNAVSADRLNRTTRELHEQFIRSELRPGDVLMAVRGSYDRAAVVPPELSGANLSRDVARIAPMDNIKPEWIRMVLTAPQTLNHFARVARGVAVKGVNIGTLRELPFPVPPTTEQDLILTEVERQFSVLDAVESVIAASRVRSESLRSSVLARAFRGGLVDELRSST